MSIFITLFFISSGCLCPVCAQSRAIPSLDLNTKWYESPLSKVHIQTFQNHFSSFYDCYCQDVALLDKLIKEDIEAGKLPLLLIANAGEILFQILLKYVITAFESSILSYLDFNGFHCYFQVPLGQDIRTSWVVSETCVISTTCGSMWRGGSILFYYGVMILLV